MAWRQTTEGKQTAKWAYDKFNSCSTLRHREEKQWNLNLAMYSGNQWAHKVPSIHGWSSDLVNTSAPRGKERRTVNRIKAICRTEMSKFLSKRPGASVIPATSEDEDFLAAQAGEQLWDALQDRAKLQDHLKSAIFWMVITGNGFIKTYWDPNKYDKDADMDGDVCYGSVDPYKIFVPDLKIEGIQNQPFVIHAYTKPTEQLKIAYAEQLKDVDLAPTRNEASTILEAAFANPRSSEEKEYDSNIVIEAWIKPGACPSLPRGGRILMVEQHVVAADIDGIPYEHGEFPFAHFRHIETGRFYGASIIEDLIDPQRSYNKIRSQIAEAIYKMGKPQLTAAKGSVSAARMTNEVGLVIEYKMGHQPPTPLPLQQLPSHIFEDINLTLADMEDISGQHQVTKGTVPPGVTAAAAISYLQEADDSYLYTSYQNVESAYEDIARQTLQLVVQYWDVPRLVKLTGADLAFSVMLLSGAELRKATDIRIEKGSALPQSKAAKQALIMDLMTNAFIPPEEGLELLEVGGAQNLLDRVKNDRRQAQRENVQFKMLTSEDFMTFDAVWNERFQQAVMENGGQPPIDPETGMPVVQPPIIPPNDFDNHAIHIEEHNRFRRGQVYATLSTEIKQALDRHVEMHKQMMANEAVQNMLAQIPTDGTTPGVSGVVPNGESVPVGGTSMTPPSEMDTVGTPAGANSDSAAAAAAVEGAV